MSKKEPDDKNKTVAPATSSVMDTAAPAVDDLAAKVKEAEAAAQKEDETAKKIADLTDALARTMADLQNFRRRSEEERGRFIKVANADLLRQLLPTFDNFHRCVAHLPAEMAANDWVKGILQMHDELFKTLEKLGVKKIETVGKPLDTVRHEALLSGPGKKDEVIEELEPGYEYRGEPIKPAKVKVGDGSK